MQIQIAGRIPGGILKGKILQALLGLVKFLERSLVNFLENSEEEYLQ